jgi:hypothetical protein
MLLRFDNYFPAIVIVFDRIADQVADQGIGKQRMDIYVKSGYEPGFRQTIVYRR